jgi:hypothetical protein
MISDDSGHEEPRSMTRGFLRQKAIEERRCLGIDEGLTILCRPRYVDVDPDRHSAT